MQCQFMCVRQESSSVQDCRLETEILDAENFVLSWMINEIYLHVTLKQSKKNGYIYEHSLIYSPHVL